MPTLRLTARAYRLDYSPDTSPGGLRPERTSGRGFRDFRDFRSFRSSSRDCTRGTNQNLVRGVSLIGHIKVNFLVPVLGGVARGRDSQ